MTDINAAVAEYIETLLWSEHCNGTVPGDVCDRGEGCDMSLLDLNYEASDLDDESWRDIVVDVTDFVESNAADLEGLTPEQIGSNFLLSRNGHGAGFWDRGWGERGDRLHEAAAVYGTMGAQVEADGKIYVHG